MNDQQTPTFEQNLSELDALVAALERGDMPLGDALKAFEGGMKLLKTCQVQLADVQMQVEKVVSADGATEVIG